MNQEINNNENTVFAEPKKSNKAPLKHLSYTKNLKKKFKLKQKV